MSQVTPLSSGTLHGQTITIELVEPGNHQPPVIVVKWPPKAACARPQISTSW